MTNTDNWKHFDVDERDPEESKLRKWMPAAGAGLLVLVLSGIAIALFRNMSGASAPQQPLIQQISLVMPPPPPPPPPEMEEPEPEMEELDLEEPEPVAEDTSEAPGEELGVDAEGVAGGDAFGLVGKKGGRGLLGDGDPNAWYAGILQRELQRLLSNDESIRGLGEYSVVVSISLSEDGYIRDSQLISGSNNPKLDAALRLALSAGVRLSREPPPDLPQPIRLRISSRS